MDDIIKLIKERIEECKRSGDMFTMPIIEGAVVDECEGDGGGSIMAHTVFTVRMPDGRSVVVDYKSKDRSHSYHIEPDRSLIAITCSDHSHDFSDSWDEGC